MRIDDAQIKDILLEQHYIDEKDVVAAQEFVDSHGGTLLDYFFIEGILDKQVLGEGLAEYYQVPFADFDTMRIDAEAIVSIPQAVTEKQGVIAFSQGKNEMKIGMLDPSNLPVRELLEKRFGKIKVYLILEEDFDKAIALYKSNMQEQFKELLDVFEKERSRESRDELVVEMVDILMQYGFENKASDIHVEPYATKIVVRFRIDGVMHDVLELPKEFSDAILTRIKILSKMRTDEHRAAQDGKFKFSTSKQRVDVRVSILPSVHGENIVMRLLTQKNRQFSLTDIGLASVNLEKIKRAIRHPHGMVLVTGPTGSGKTTTLYAVLKILNERKIHIATIEDPVEYNVEGVTQIQVNTKTDLTFAKGLRSLVRQDPDIIMVGEIRDEVTANIATNAALTGHLVLSTLHTNDAPTTLPRLLDMEVEPFLVASTINIIIAQRLVRKICTHCRASYRLTEEDKLILKGRNELLGLAKSKGYDAPSKWRLYKGAGCKICGDTGYHGRIGIFEVLEMSEGIRPFVVNQGSSDEIKEQAIKEGMITLLEDGMDKVFNGVTTLEEILRVAET
ncbi:type II/IV secretion system protein [Patescibacteria group bacterium]|nr:type II/IV secretion system protein [Patescibacteria group bacterium]MBU1721178.1 type II/IV secretion system protein [Patescibacteria group bacterium]MBU1900892.1 type II/IV secretion system protein [Patescibacteria group bacterium]